MFDDSELFDKNDNIVIYKDKIVLQKQNNNNKSIIELNKHLKDLDGNWELDVQIDDNESTSKNWIFNNDKNIEIMYSELKSKSVYSDVLNNLSINVLSDYLENMCISKYKYKNSDWNSYEEYKLYGMKKPGVNEWTSFHIIELHKLYNTYDTYFKLGKIEEFIKFCFKNSITNRLPQY